MRSVGLFRPLPSSGPFDDAMELVFDLTGDVNEDKEEVHSFYPPPPPTRQVWSRLCGVRSWTACGTTCPPTSLALCRKEIFRFSLARISTPRAKSRAKFRGSFSTTTRRLEKVTIDALRTRTFQNMRRPEYMNRRVFPDVDGKPSGAVLAKRRRRSGVVVGRRRMLASLSRRLARRRRQRSHSLGDDSRTGVVETHRFRIVRHQGFFWRRNAGI